MPNAVPIQRNDQLDGLRGYAAMAVVIFHAVLGLDPTLVPRVLRANFAELSSWYDLFAKIVLEASSGETAVCIFFVLSGAVLFDSLKRTKGAPLRLVIDFIVRRLFRIYPALIVCLIFSAAALAAIGTTVTPDALLKNAALYEFGVNGVTWTLNVEMVAVPFLLASFFAYRFGGERALLCIALIFYAALRAPWPHPPTLTFKFYWIYFALGMLITTPYGRWLAERLPSAAWIPALLIGIIAKGVPQQFAIALLVLVLYYGRGGSLERVLRRPFSQFLGRISYSFYLFNVVLLSIVEHLLSSVPLAKAHPVEVGLLASFVVIPLTFPIAHLSVKLIEGPGIRLGQYLLGGAALRGLSPAPLATVPNPMPSHNPSAPSPATETAPSR
jgi:peptidoglycan/LPS O-acetylase OafA/YrhL